jgi:hypothetical protein
MVSHLGLHLMLVPALSHSDFTDWTQDLGMQSTIWNEGVSVWFNINTGNNTFAQGQKAQDEASQSC